MPRSDPPAGGAFLIEEAPAGSILTPERLDAEARMLAEAAAGFMRGEVLPAADRLEAHEAALMPALLRRAGALGLLGIDIPEAYGGLSLPKSVSARIAEAVAVEPSFAVSHNVHTSVASLPLVFFGTPEQKAKYLPRLASGDWIGAYALSESHAGSDALAARTRAILSPDGKTYTLTGEKMWITNAAFADLFTVFAKVDGEKFTAFLVERGFPGLSIGREEHKLGLKGSSTCRLILDSVLVPAENVLGAVGEGAKVALYTLNLGRFKIAASSVGQSKNLLGLATRYAKQRTAFGRPIAEFGLIQQKLATMAARCFGCESMLYRVAGYLDASFKDEGGRMKDEGMAQDLHPSSFILHPSEEYAIECAMLKVACTEALDYCADECLQIHGGYGYTEEFPAARAWRDARINRIYEGTNEINRLNIVQLLLKRIEKGRLPMPKDEVLQTALASFEDLAEQQQVCSALADLLIGEFAGRAVMARAGLSPDTARFPRGYWITAQLWALDADIHRRACVDIVLGACGERGQETWEGLKEFYGRLEPMPNVVEHREQLAAAVIEADGYPW